MCTYVHLIQCYFCRYRVVSHPPYCHFFKPHTHLRANFERKGASGSGRHPTYPPLHRGHLHGPWVNALLYSGVSLHVLASYLHLINQSRTTICRSPPNSSRGCCHLAGTPSWRPLWGLFSPTDSDYRIILGTGIATRQNVPHMGYKFRYVARLNHLAHPGENSTQTNEVY